MIVENVCFRQLNRNRHNEDSLLRINSQHVAGRDAKVRRHRKKMHKIAHPTVRRPGGNQRAIHPPPSLFH